MENVQSLSNLYDYDFCYWYCVTGNILTIIAIKTSKQLQNPTNILLGSLAAADLFTSLFSAPVRVSIAIFDLFVYIYDFHMQSGTCTLTVCIQKPTLVTETRSKVADG